MIYLYPERHANTLDLDALVQRANRGDIFLLMEDSPTALTFNSPFIDALEPVEMMSLDTMLACMVMMCDTTHDIIGDYPGTEGYVLYSMFVYVLGWYPDERFAGLNYIGLELRTIGSKSLPEVYQAVKTISDALLGGIPRSVKRLDISQFVDAVVSARTGLSAKQHMALYNFIKREKTMAEKIQAVSAKHKGLDIHVIVGACHISGDLADGLLDSLAVNVPSYKELTTLVEGFYPKQRLLDLIGDYVVR